MGWNDLPRTTGSEDLDSASRFGTPVLDTVTGHPAGTPVPSRKKWMELPQTTISYVKDFKQAILEQPCCFWLGLRFQASLQQLQTYPSQQTPGRRVYTSTWLDLGVTRLVSPQPSTIRDTPKEGPGTCHIFSALRILGPSLEGVEPSSSQGFGAPNPTLVLFRVQIITNDTATRQAPL